MARNHYTRSVHKKDERARRVRERELRELMKELRAEWEQGTDPLPDSDIAEDDDTTESD